MVKITISHHGFDRYIELLTDHRIPALISLSSEGYASFTIEEKHYKKASDLWEIVRKEIWGY